MPVFGWLQYKEQIAHMHHWYIFFFLFLSSTGALFDVRARHLTDTFETAVNLHNSDEIHQHGSQDPDEVGIVHGRKDDAIKIIFEPVITFVDVTDSFAVSNASKIFW